MTHKQKLIVAAIATVLGTGGWVAANSVASNQAAVELRSANGQKAKALKSVELNDKLMPLIEAKPSHQKEVVVSGEMKLDYPYLQADTLRFEPGAKLVISAKAMALRPQAFLVVKELVVMDPNNPGVITWEKPAAATPPAAPGEAPAGAAGNGFGAAGQVGQPGGKGIAGEQVQAAPHLTLVVMKVPSAGVLVDLTGADGNQGSPGQKGGHGGAGAQGNAASQSMFDCKRGAGNGGAAGPGGPGGVGGDGGRGGSGGTFLMVSADADLPSLTQKFRVKVGPGNGGAGGAQGVGGAPGLAGPAGQEAKPYCGGANAGANAGAGPLGERGEHGLAGAEGDFTVGVATGEQVERYVWPAERTSIIDKIASMFAR